MQILHLDSGIQGVTSISRQLTASVVKTLRGTAPNAVVVYRDLVAEPIPHLDGAIAAGFRELGIQPTSEVTLAERARSDALVEELLASDLLVIGAPMYNFAVPTQLKAWIDRVVQPGRTFQFSPQGPIGKVTGIRAVIASSRGGVYTEASSAALDFQENYLRAILAFIGIRDVRTVRAEGVKGADGAKAIEEALLDAAVVAETLPRGA